MVSTFEEYPPDAPVRLLYSAQAWHWTDPAVGGEITLDVGTVLYPGRRARD